MTARKNIKLKTISDVSRFLADLINEVRHDEISEGTAAKLGSLANILVSTIKDGELEERLARVEEQLQEKGERLEFIES